MKESEVKPSIEEQWLEVDGLRIHCFGAGETGSPVVLLHGGRLDSASISWRACIGPLSAQHQVFAPDLPGYGQSARKARALIKNSELYIVPQTKHWPQGEKPEEFTRVALQFL